MWCRSAIKGTRVRHSAASRGAATHLLCIATSTTDVRRVTLMTTTPRQPSATVLYPYFRQIKSRNWQRKTSLNVIWVCPTVGLLSKPIKSLRSRKIIHDKMGFSFRVRDSTSEQAKQMWDLLDVATTETHGHSPP